MNKPKVYIAGKLNDPAINYLKNVHNMIEWSEKVRRLGYAVYVPATDMLVGIVKGDLEYQDYFDNGQAFLLICNAIFVCPGFETSKGTLKEIETAQKHNIPVFYNIDSLKTWFDNNWKG